MTPEIISDRHPAFWHRRLMVVVCIQVSFLMITCCNAGAPEKGIGETADIKSMQQKLVEMNRQEKALLEEFSLARNSTPYLIIHSTNSTIELKARGRVLRTFKIKEISEWDVGTSNDIAWMVMEMAPIQRSDRPKIKPGAGEEATAEAAKQNLWGLHRMPLDYNLFCSDGNILEIRGFPSGQSSIGIFKSIKFLYRRSIDRYRRWRIPRNPELKHTIRLWLDENDSRLLFWSLPKQIKMLVLSQSYPIANIIVVEQARLCNVEVSWKEHTKVGISVTLVTLFLAAVWLWLRS
jgi:hypothetical protein